MEWYVRNNEQLRSPVSAPLRENLCFHSCVCIAWSNKMARKKRSVSTDLYILVYSITSQTEDCFKSTCPRLSLIQSLVYSSSFSSSNRSFSRRLFSSWLFWFFEQRRQTRSRSAVNRRLYRLISNDVAAYDGFSSMDTFLFLRNAPMWFSRSRESFVVSSHVWNNYQLMHNNQ